MPDPDYVREELDQAQTALTDAQILEDGEGSPRCDRIPWAGELDMPSNTLGRGHGSSV